MTEQKSPMPLYIQEAERKMYLRQRTAYEARKGRAATEAWRPWG